MELIIDLHTHSHYSRATSKESTLEGLYRWGKIKGINIIGTGDFTHPVWFEEIKEKLEPAEPGLFKLKDQYAKVLDTLLPQSVREGRIRFTLTAEISNIYSKNGKTRKLHILLVAPSFETVLSINEKLSKIGNLKADGRPILGLDSKELLKIVLHIDPNVLFIPAHIWTPWFAMFGSKSGFDSMEEAFGEMVKDVHAVETGLSSDPYMNWRVGNLDNITIISNSDAHSPSKLGREATVINSKLDYFDIIEGIRTNDKRIVGTIEFFPQEGKYHYDGHREHNICFSPKETKEHDGICPVCHKPLTIGVDHRVDDLATQSPEYKPKNHKMVEYIIPLIEIIAEIRGKGSNSKDVIESYEKIFSVLGSEFDILRKIPLKIIKQEGFFQLSQALEKMRKEEVYIEPGYDGVFGKIKVFGSVDERKKNSGQMALL